MTQNLSKREIKDIVLSSVDVKDVEKIILFGSRARGDFNDHSDYDIIIIVKNENISRKEKLNLFFQINNAFADKSIPIDLLIRTKEQYEYYKDKIGNVIKYSLNESVLLYG